MPRKSEPTLSNSIRDLRASSDEMTQQDLADQVGVTRQTIIALEKGAYTPSLALAIRIARLFRKPVEEIFRLEE